MPEIDELRHANESLRRRNDELLRRLMDSEHACDAVALRNSTAFVVAQNSAQENTRRSESHFRAVIEKSAEIISLTAADGTTQYLTPSVYRMFGWTPEEMGTRSLRELVIPEDQTRIALELARLVRTGDRDIAMEFRMRHRDGSIRWIESTGTNLLDDPDVAAIVGNHRDITRRKIAEAALLETVNQLEAAQVIAHIGSWTSGIRREDAIQWTRECCRIFGVPDGTVFTVGELFERVSPDDREALLRANRDALERDIPIDIEHRLERPDGMLCWVHAQASVERGPAGQPVRMVGTVQDTTAHHVALDAQRESDERYRRIVEGTSEGVWMYDVEATTTFMNVRMAEMLGCTVDEAVGQPIYNFMDEPRRAAARTRVEQRQHGLAERSDFCLRRKDGTDLWVSIQANALFDAEGRFEAALALVTDISAQRLANEARFRLAAIIEWSEDAILSASLDGTITSWNQGAHKLYQFTADEVIGQSVVLLVPPALVEAELRMLEQVGQGEAVRQHETRRRRKDGSIVDVALTVSPIRDAAGKIIGVSKIVRDLTAQRRAEAVLRRTENQFRQVQKMDAVGRLAAGVAHDFNNLLAVILSYADLSLAVLKPGDPLHADLTEVRIAGQRASDLTRQLLAFSRQQVLQPRVIDLTVIVIGMKSMLVRLLGEDVNLTVLTAPDVGRVLADPGQIEQVLMNLAVNARDAMLDGGDLTIGVTNERIDGPSISSGHGPAEGDFVMLAITDTGTGMNDEVRAQIFEPFFTTKEQGKGTGLGLATVFGIVKQSGGYVSVYSEPGVGSTFKVYLPRTDRVADVPGHAATLPIRRGSETIMVVEDEEQVRTVTCTILRRNGYHVLEASNGGEAYLLSKDFGATIHLMLTDVVMPRMSGRRLVEQLGPERPQMKVLFASGYTDDAIIHHGILDAGVAFLQKPFTPDRLLRKVREVLDGRPN